MIYLLLVLMPPQAPEPVTPYVYMARKAVRENKKLYIFVNQPIRDVPKDALSLRVTELTGYTGPCLIIAVPKGRWLVEEKVIYLQAVRVEPVRSQNC